MMKWLKRITALVMVAVMVVTMNPVSAQAAAKKKGTVKSVTIKNLDTKTLVLKKGKTFKLKVAVKVTGKASKKVKYTTSNKKVATVSSGGKIKAVKNGTAKITVKSAVNSKKKASFTVKVGTPIKTVKLNTKKVTAYVGDKVTLKATISPKKTTIKKVSFTSGNKKVATVDKKGIVTCVAAGTVKITAKSTDGSDKKAVCTVTVLEKKEPTQEPTTEPTTEENKTTEKPSEKPTEKPEEVVMGTDLSYEGYELDWADEFDGSKLDRSNWNVELHEPGWVNAELQKYVDSEENIYLKDGKLVLNPIQKKNSDGTYSYTSGRVNTQNKKTYTYGMFEVKAKVPEGKGYLPAFWLMANDENIYGQWPRCGEIDIMEVMGQDTKTSHGTIHYGNPHKQNQGTYVLNQGSFSKQYHTFTCKWEPGKIVWYIDGNEFYQTSDWYSATEGGGTITYPAPFDQPFYIILNLAVGGSWVGYPDDENFVSQPYMIDYVRVYQKEEGYDDTNVKAPEKQEVVLREPDEDGNYIINGNFQEVEDLKEATGWQFKTASGGVGSTVIAEGEDAIEAIDGNSAIVQTTECGSVDYAIQLLQNDIPLKAGATYELSYDAYATGSRKMKVNSKAPNNGWHAYLDVEQTLTTTLQTFKHEFVMTHADDPACTIEFNMGNYDSTESIVIDNVTLKIVDMNEELRDSIINPSKTVRADGNYVYNGQFQEGDKYLGFWQYDAEDAISVTPFADGRRLKVVVPEDGAVEISQSDIPVLASEKYELSMDSEIPEDGIVQVEFLGETYDVTNGKYSNKVITGEEVADNTLTITFEGPGTYYLDNVRIVEDALIKNGSFNAGLAGFDTYAYSNDLASFGVDTLSNDNAAAININKTDKEAWYIQLKQNGIDLEKGQWYRLSLDAKSTMDRKLMFAIQRDGSKHNDDWTPFSGEKIVDLSNEYTTYSLEFEMKEPTDMDAVLSISMGAVGGTAINTPHSIYIDNLLLEKIEEPEVSVIAGENMLVNPSFSDNGAGWDKILGAPAAGTITTGENYIEYALTNVGTEDHHVQLKQTGLQLETGETYRIRFKVISSEERMIKTSVMSANYNWYGGQDTVLTKNQVSEISFDITMKENDLTAGLFVSLGQMYNVVYGADGSVVSSETIDTPASIIRLYDMSVVKLSK